MTVRREKPGHEFRRQLREFGMPERIPLASRGRYCGIGGKEDTGLEQLGELVGLSEIKRQIDAVNAMEQMQRFRTSKRLKRPPVSYHAVLVGNPGTGKTTVARLYGRILYEAGLLRCGHFVEARRGELVGKYLGQTAPKVAAKVEEALGGVLFIDEAYALARKDSGDSYGDEAIDTLVPLMENHRDDLVVLLAGYEKEMETFMRRNPGLDSRISTWFRFPDFDPEELLHILDGLCEHYDYELSEQARERAYLEFIAAYERRGIEYGNARLARKMFEASITNHARRLAYCALSKNEERLLTPQDVPACTSLQ